MELGLYKEKRSSNAGKCWWRRCPHEIFLNTSFRPTSYSQQGRSAILLVVEIYLPVDQMLRPLCYCLLDGFVHLCSTSSGLSKPDTFLMLFGALIVLKKKRLWYKTLARPACLLNCLVSPRCRYAKQHSLVTQPHDILLFSPSWRSPPSRLGFQKGNMGS